MQECTIVGDDSHTLLALRHTTSLRSFRRYRYDGECYGNLAWRIFARIMRRLLSGCHLLFTRGNLLHHSGARTDADIHIIANYARYATRVNRGNMCWRSVSCILLLRPLMVA